MKISKTAVLALGGVFMAAGLGLMFVSADEAVKHLKIDMDNAVQHFYNVRFISSGATDSVVDMTRVGGEDPLIRIDANNFVITQTGSAERNVVSAGYRNSILGGIKNVIGGSSDNVILGGSGNKTASQSDVILGGVSNIVTGSYSDILGGSGNKTNNHYAVIIGGSDNEVTSQYSVAVGKNIHVLKKGTSNVGNSIALGSNATVEADKSFLWSDGTSVTLGVDNLFAVKGASGMVVNANAAHSFAKLTIGGSLVITNKNQALACNPAMKGILKLKKESGKTCFCSCDGSGWNSVIGGGVCMGICNDDRSKAKCNYGADLNISCNVGDNGSYVYTVENGCERGNLVEGTGGLLIDEGNKMRWTCLEANGDSTGCVSPFEVQTCDVVIPTVACDTSHTNPYNCVLGTTALDGVSIEVLNTGADASKYWWTCKYGVNSEYCERPKCNRTITYNANGGMPTPSNQVVACGDSTLLASAPIRGGYTFGGWRSSENSQVYTAGVSYTPSTSPVTMTAQWSACNRTIKYNANGGTPTPSDQTVACGSSKALASAPTRTGYTFAGWKSSEDSQNYAAGVNYTPSTSPVTMTAQWSACNRTIKYNANGGTPTPSDQTVACGSSAALASAPTKSGKTFAGWKSSENDQTYAVGANYTPSASTVTMTAQWADCTRTIKYNADGGTPTPSNQSVECGSSAALASAPTRAGYTFAGWKSSENDQTYAAGASYAPSASTVTMTAQWSTCNRTIKYNADGGIPTPSNQLVACGSSAELAVAPTKSGKTFAGWKSSEDDQTYAAGTTYAPSESTVTMTAQWADCTRTIKYNAGGGTPTPSDQSVECGSSAALASAPTKAGKTFAGWRSSENGQPYAAGATYTPSASTVTMTAQWSDCNRTIKYNAGGGTPTPSDQLVACGSSTALASAPEKSGETFVGWKSSEHTDQIYAAGSIYAPSASTVTMTAQWAPCTRTIKYNTNGGTPSTISPLTLLCNTQGTLASAPTKAGETFIGWESSEDNKLYSGGAKYKPLASTVTMTARWQPCTRTINYDTNGGTPSSIASLTLLCNTQGTLAAEPTKAGSVFAGWKSSENNKLYSGGAKYTPSTSPVTMTAQWTTPPCTRTINYNTNGGTPATIASLTLLCNTSGKLASDPTKAGKTFKGWKSSEDNKLYSGGVYYTPKSSPVTMTAQWEDCNRTIRYDANGGTPTPSNQTVACGSSKTLASGPTKAGKIFAGWVSSEDGQTYASGATYTPSASTVTMTAAWSDCTRTIKYDADGGTPTPSDQSVECGSSKTLATAPTKPLYTFTGWKSSEDSKIYRPGASYTPKSSPVTMKAQWTLCTRTIKYNANGGTPTPSDQSVSCGGSKILASGPTKSGKTFAGWVSSEDGQTYASGATYTPSASTVTMTAVWADCTRTIKYNANGGTPTPSDQSVACGSSAALASAPAKAGWTFIAWKSSENSQEYFAGASYTPSASTVTMTAQWAPCNRTIKYDANGGTPTPSNQVVACESSTNLASAPTRTGYNFVAWESSFNSQRYQPGVSYTPIASTVTMKAIWAKISYSCPSTLAHKYECVYNGTYVSGTSTNYAYNEYDWLCNDGSLTCGICDDGTIPDTFNAGACVKDTYKRACLGECLATKTPEGVICDGLSATQCSRTSGCTWNGYRCHGGIHANTEYNCLDKSKLKCTGNCSWKSMEAQCVIDSPECTGSKLSEMPVDCFADSETLCEGLQIPLCDNRTPTVDTLPLCGSEKYTCAEGTVIKGTSNGLVPNTWICRNDSNTEIGCAYECKTTGGTSATQSCPHHYDYDANDGKCHLNYKFCVRRLICGRDLSMGELGCTADDSQYVGPQDQDSYASCFGDTSYKIAGKYYHMMPDSLMDFQIWNHVNEIGGMGDVYLLTPYSERTDPTCDKGAGILGFPASDCNAVLTHYTAVQYDRGYYFTNCRAHPEYNVVDLCSYGGSEGTTTCTINRYSTSSNDWDRLQLKIDDDLLQP